MDQPPEIKRHTIFDCFSPNCGAALVPAVAEILAEGLNASQVAVLGNFLAAVGDTLSYMSSQAQMNEQLCPKRKSICADTRQEDETSEDAS